MKKSDKDEREEEKPESSIRVEERAGLGVCHGEVMTRSPSSITDPTGGKSCCLIVHLNGTKRTHTESESDAGNKASHARSANVSAFSSLRLLAGLTSHLYCPLMRRMVSHTSWFFSNGLK